MTTEQAIYQLTDLIRDRESFCHRDDFDEVFLQDIKACKAGIKALEKRKPKRLIKFGEDHYDCPDCMKRFNGFVQFRYCSGCGQALDWSEENE